MDTKTLQKIQMLLASANGMEGFWAKYHNLKGNPQNDKIDAKFTGLTDRSDAFNVKATFQAYCGQYGSSSVYTMSGFPSKELAAEYIIRAMNNFAPELFAEAARLMRKDAAASEAAARGELNKLSSMLDLVISGEAAQ